jgi:DNA-binding GntR family transcriptional regulator
MRKVPYYLQIRDHLASQIETAALRPNAKLPSERTLSDAFGITRMTARQALLQLEAEGLIHRLDRRGWFVSPPRLQYDPTLNISFTENVASQGRVPGTVLLSQEQTTASTWDFNHLGVTAEEPVFLIRRLRLIDQRPVLVEHLHVNANRCPGLLDLPLDQSLTKLLAEHYGIIERRARIRVRPTALTASQAEPLQVAAGTPGLYLTRTTYDQDDNVVEFDQEFWRYDVLEVAIEVHTEAMAAAPVAAVGSSRSV